MISPPRQHMEDKVERLRCILEDAVSACTAECIALSGGLDSSIIAHLLKGRKAKAVSVIAKDFVASDLTYCQLVAQKTGLPLSIRMCDIGEIYSALEDTVRILGNFNDIEIRNNSVMHLAISSAKDDGFGSILTGDGADEVFAGYNFLVNKHPDELKSELVRIAGIMHFPSHAIGKALNVRVESPFCSAGVTEFAKSLPAERLVNTHEGKRYGKWILRKAFEDAIPTSITWRQKSPMQDGAGTHGLTEFFDRVIPDSVFASKVKKIKKDDGVTIRSKESLQYYEIFTKHHRIPEAGADTTPCPDCGFGIEGRSRFCRMCGRFPI